MSSLGLSVALAMAGHCGLSGLCYTLDFHDTVVLPFPTEEGVGIPSPGVSPSLNCP